MLVDQSMECAHFIFRPVLPLCYFGESLEKGVEGHVGFVFVGGDEDEVDFLLLVQVLLVRPIDHYLRVLHHLVELLGLQVLNVESVSETAVVVKHRPHFPFYIIDRHLALA